MCGKTMPKRKKKSNFCSWKFTFSPVPVEFWTAIHDTLTMSCLLAFFSLCSSLVLDVSLSPFPCVDFFGFGLYSCGYKLPYPLFHSWKESPLTGFILSVLSLILVHFFCLVLHVMTATKSALWSLLGETRTCFISPAEQSRLVMRIQAFSWNI